MVKKSNFFIARYFGFYTVTICGTIAPVAVVAVGD